MYDNTVLTSALETLSDTNTAVTDFLKAAPELKALSVPGKLAADVKAGEATAQDIKDYYADQAGVASLTGLNASFATLNAKNQDSLIKDEKASLQTAVDIATDAAKDGMTALLKKVDTAKANYDAKAKVVSDNTKTESDELALFNTANSNFGTGSALSSSKIIFTNAEDTANTVSGNAYIVDGKYYVASSVTTIKALVEAGSGVDVKRGAEYKSAVDALANSQASLATAYTALETAVKNVYNLENSDKFGVFSLGAAINTYGTKVAVDLENTSNDVELYETKADADVFGLKQTVTVGGDATGAGTITIAGVEITVGNSDAKEAIAKAIANAFKNNTSWKAEVDSSNTAQVNFTAKKVTDALDSTAGTPNVSSTATGATVAAAATSVTFFNPTSTKAQDLQDAIEALADFNKDVDAFTAARDLNTELKALEKAVDDAKAAISNATDDEDAPGLGVNLVDADTSGDVDFSIDEDDLYVFNTADAKQTGVTEVTIVEFSGKDKIFFGNTFDGGLVKIKDPAKENGDAAKLEIFWKQNGSDVELYVEEKAFAGNVTGTNDLVKVVLTGVKDGADLSLTEDGFLVIA